MKKVIKNVAAKMVAIMIAGYLNALKICFVDFFTFKRNTFEGKMHRRTKKMFKKGAMKWLKLLRQLENC